MNTQNKPIYAMIHCSGQSDRILDRALMEINILEEEGVDGIIIENYHGSSNDVKNILIELSNQKTKLKIGVNILPNEWKESIVLAETYHADFVQLDYISGNYNNNVSFDQHEQDYFNCRSIYNSIKVLGGVWPKYYTPNKNSILEDDIKNAIKRADGIVVTGTGTGKETPLDKIKEFKRIIDLNDSKTPLIIGAGLSSANVKEQLIIADAAIVGSCFKPYYRTTELIKREYVKEFMDEVIKIR